MSKKTSKMDLTRGPVFTKLLAFAIPILFTNFLQQLYNAADTMVVGKFDGDLALAAVGATGAVTNLILHLFVGMATGANVIVAQHIGAGDRERTKRAVETSIIVSVLSGILLIFVGLFCSRTLLIWQKCPESVLNDATKYMQIYFAGSPFSLIYNFGSGILRANGDTKRPMYILTVSGIVNVLLNLLFVIVFHMGAAGVATATVISQAVTALWILAILYHPTGDYRVKLRKMVFDIKELWHIVRIGIPVGLNGIMFSVASVIIQSEVNSLGDLAVAATSAANSLDRFTYLGITSFSQAAISMAGQNVGAKKYKRLDSILIQCIGSALVFIGVLSVTFVVFKNFFVGFYTDSQTTIDLALPKLIMVGFGYFFCAPEDILGQMLKGMGKSVPPMIMNLVCVCGVRVLWLYTMYHPHFIEGNLVSNLYWLNAAFGVSWACSAVGQLILYIYYRKKVFTNAIAEEAALAEAAQ